jgi:hypothetical protein
MPVPRQDEEIKPNRFHGISRYLAAMQHAKRSLNQRPPRRLEPFGQMGLTNFEPQIHIMEVISTNRSPP